MENKFKERFGASNLPNFSGNFASPGYGKAGKLVGNLDKSIGPINDKNVKVDAYLESMKNSFVAKTSGA